MNILLQILIFAGIGLVVFAIFGVIFSGSSEKRIKKQKEPASDFKEQKIQRLEREINFLSGELEKVKADFANVQKECETTKHKELQLKEELTRKQDWVGKAEDALNKIKEENSDLNDRFQAKEKELQEEFAKNVNLNIELKELKERLVSLEKENKNKSDQIEAQKHQIEKYEKDIKKLVETIAEFKKKEQISEWVPKQELNKLKEELTQLRNQLEKKEQEKKENQS